jgi:hypothetical protein
MVRDNKKPTKITEQYFARKVEQLASDFNRYRLKSDKTLQRVVVGGTGCGAGGINVTFVPNPQGAQVFIIPTLFYEYCIKQGIDPYDRVLCDRWRPVHSTISSEVAGEYHYVAKWPDGVEVKNEIDFENLGDDNAKVDKPSSH